MRRIFFIMTVFALAAAAPAGARASSPAETLKTLPVLDSGRVMPLDTFARRFAVSVTGSESYAGRDHMELLLLFLLDYDRASREPLVCVRFPLVKERLALPQSKTHFSASDLAANKLMVDVLRAGTAPGREILFEEVYELNNLLRRLSDLRKELRIVPPATGADKWRSLADIRDTAEQPLLRVLAAFKAMKDSSASRDESGFAAAAAEFSAALRAVNPGAWPGETALRLEVLDNEIRPFQKAWILYLAGFASSAAMMFLARGRLRLLGFALVLAALLLHTGGLAARAVIAGRALPADMFESVVFMGWGAMALGLIFGAIYRRAYLACVASLVAGLALLAGGGGEALRPLPLIISNSAWLVLHVAVMVVGYAALALAWGLGHFAWGVYCFAPKKRPLFQALTLFIYRAVQVGLLFVIAGTIMGGVWANEAWGRFWGWDPKETWALITILVYAAILHALRCGWLRGFGLVIASIAGFLAVLMTWYGVNCLLGTGLHAYGFGSGAGVLALPILAAEFLIILAAVSFRSARISAPVEKTSPEP